MHLLGLIISWLDNNIEMVGSELEVNGHATTNVLDCITLSWLTKAIGRDRPRIHIC